MSKQSLSYIFALSFLFSVSLSWGGQWDFLTITDKIDVLGPLTSSCPFSEVALDTCIRNHNLIGGVRVHKGMFSISHIPESLAQEAAGSDNPFQSPATSTFQALLLNPQTKAIWGGNFECADLPCLWEGGTIQLPQRIIPLIGFGEFTILHLWAHQQKWPSLHGVLASFSRDMRTMLPNSFPALNANTPLHPLLHTLGGKAHSMTYLLDIINPPAFNSLQLPLTTTLLGGNLSIVHRSIGTPLEPNLAGAVLFLEDTEKEEQHLKTLLTQMMEAKLFDAVQAIAFGDLPIQDGVSLRNILGDLDQMLEERGIRKPLFHKSDFFGHGPLNMLLPLGTHMTLESDIFNTTRVQFNISVNQSAYV